MPAREHPSTLTVVQEVLSRVVLALAQQSRADLLRLSEQLFDASENPHLEPESSVLLMYLSEGLRLRSQLPPE